MNQLKEYEYAEDQGALSSEEISIVQIKKLELERLNQMNEASCRQKSRMVWLTQGDQNTKKFQAYANVRKKSNTISTLRCQGTLSTDLSVIKAHIIEFYINLYIEEEEQRPTLDGVQFPAISMAEQQLLQRPFTMDEVLQAIHQLSQEKAPGPDGFPLIFFSTFWEEIKVDFMAVIEDFFHHSVIDWRMNTTFLLLLPKKAQVEDVGDFRPIALLSSSYKIISKILASRLRMVIHKLISQHQSAYIHGRQIIDGILIANELVDSILKSRKPGIVCKIDMEKAFDKVSWKFIDYMLFRMGFGLLWRRWIWTCLSSASFSILFNGASCGFFKSSRGVRQGDPLSPMLFDLAMEGVSSLIQKATSLNKVVGFQVCNSSESITHLHYADDTILFIEAVEEQLDYMISIMKFFETVSGLKVNLTKTNLIAVGEVPMLQFWAMKLGCGIDVLPTRYLGLPLGASQRMKETWDPMIERVDQRLASWKGKLLTKGGRMTLIKSTLVNMPLYYLSVYLAPAKVIHTLEKKIKKFLWSQGGKVDKGYHLVNWETCCLSKENGGLGFKKLKWMNRALLGKWVWRFGNDTDSLWRKVINDKFGVSSTKWIPKKSYTSQGVGCWQRIHSGSTNITNWIRFGVNSGSQVRLWEDQWVDGGSLAYLYPSLYSKSKQKNQCIRDFVSPLNSNEWCFKFRGMLSHEEEHELTILKAIIGPSHALNSLEDQRIWVGGGGGNSFSVKACYEALTDTGSHPYPSAFIWNNRVPTKISFFLWTAADNKCLTLENLQKRGWHLTSVCLLCKLTSESIFHLLLQCPFSWKIWSYFIPRSWIWAIPRDLIDLAYLWIENPNWSEQAKYIWSILPMAICWSLWLERNACTHKGKVAAFDVVCNRIRGFIFLWAKKSNDCTNISFQHLVSNWESIFSEEILVVDV